MVRACVLTSTWLRASAIVQLFMVFTPKIHKDISYPFAAEFAALVYSFLARTKDTIGSTMNRKQHYKRKIKSTNSMYIYAMLYQTDERIYAERLIGENQGAIKAIYKRYTIYDEGFMETLRV